MKNIYSKQPELTKFEVAKGLFIFILVGILIIKSCLFIWNFSVHVFG